MFLQLRSWSANMVLVQILSIDILEKPGVFRSLEFGEESPTQKLFKNINN